MIGIRALRVLDEAPDVLVLALRTLRLPLERVLDAGLGSVRTQPRAVPGPNRWGRRLFRGRRAMVHDMDPCIQVARHAIRTASGVEHRFDGLLVGTRLAALTRYARDHYLFEPGTVLAEFGGDPATQEARLAAALENAVGRDGWDDPMAPGLGGESASLPGIRYEVNGGTVAALHEVHERGATWMIPHSRDGAGVEARSHLRFGPHRVPIRVRLSGPAMHGGSLAWFDGRQVGISASVEALPGRLVAELRRAGRAPADLDEPIRPLCDLRPAFLLRVPTGRERSRLGAGSQAPVPAVAARPAVLLSTESCLPLQGRNGSVIPLPVVSDPREAMAILARCSGSEVYVPRIEPRDWRDVRVAPGLRWMVAATPLEID